MDNYTISILNNKIFFQIISEIKLFSKFKINYYDNIDLCIENKKKENQIVVLFNHDQDKVKKNDLPTLLAYESTFKKNKILSEISSELIMPFTILEFEKRIIFLIARNEFKKNSLIHLGDYIIDKNERKIKKNNLELQLSEKEINFLVFFSKKKVPLSKNIVLKTVWNYSSESETHTIETHIHRLRKKILKKFNDNNFIKNNSKGYYI